MSSIIHPTAIVSSSATIGKNVTIGAYACIEDDVIIGDDSIIQQFATVKQYSRLGKGNKIHSYAAVGDIPQDLKFNGEFSTLEVGDNNTIREFSTIHRGTEGGGGVTKIGSNNLFMAYSHIAHDCLVGNNVIMSNGATLGGHVTVENHAIIGGLSAVHQFSRIGEYSFVGGMTGCSQDLPPYMLAVGNRAHIQGLNIVGLRRKGVNSATIASLRQVFRIILLSGIPRQDSLAKVSEEFADIPEAISIINFIKASSRGFLPALKNVKEE